MILRSDSRLILALVLALTLIPLLAAGALAADTDNRWGVGLEGGLMKPFGDDRDYSNVDQFFGLKLGYGLTPHWKLHAGYQYGFNRLGVDTRGNDAGWTYDSGQAFYTMVSQPSIGLQYRMLPERAICPTLGVGLGVNAWKFLDLRGQDAGLFPSGSPATGFDADGTAVDLEGTDLAMTVEAGLDIFLRESLAFNLGGRLNFMPANDKDNVGSSVLWDAGQVDANTGRLDVYAGLTWWFGSRDNDHDGILNADDTCPDQAEDRDGFKDEDGCPDPDNDGDRILDGEDSCPNEPEDFDGFEDHDGCPEADNDGDGIIDADDRCPDEAEDMDGFEDADGCPEADNDGDGVLDADDRCPGTPANTKIDEYGCPVIEEIKQDLILEGVTFVSGSAELTPESVGILSKVGESLRAWPAVKIEIRGHTDSTGSDEVNRDLSHRRALAVKDSLVHMGIDPGRLSAVGYGEDYPLADNRTAEGRRINRRVEIHKVN